MIRDNDPFPRKQADGKQEQYSREAALEFDPAEDKARQEFKDEADVNKILTRHGVRVRVDGSSGDFDYTVDLQQAMDAVAQASRLRSRLPEDVRAKYETWQQVMAAAASGELEKDLDRSEVNRQRARQELRHKLEEEEIVRAERDRDKAMKEFARSLDNPDLSKKPDK